MFEIQMTPKSWKEKKKKEERNYYKDKEKKMSEKKPNFCFTNHNINDKFQQRLQFVAKDLLLVMLEIL